MHCDASRAWASVRACLQSPCRHFSDPAEPCLTNFVSVLTKVKASQVTYNADQNTGFLSDQPNAGCWFPPSPAPQSRLTIPRL